MEKAKWTNLFINIALFFILGAFAASIMVGIGIFTGKIEASTIKLLLDVIGTILLSTILYELKKIVQLVMQKQVFSMENVKRFNIISYILYVLAVGFCFVNNGESGMQIIAINDIFAVKFETVILLVLGSFSAVVAYVFHEAIKIREESEKLKEESKYII